MPRIATSSYFNQANGRVGDLVFYSIGKRQYSRMYIIPANPDTEQQRLIRRSFGDAVRSWQARKV